MSTSKIGKSLLSAILLLLTVVENGGAHEIGGQTIANQPSKAILQNSFTGMCMSHQLVCPWSRWDVYVLPTV